MESSCPHHHFRSRDYIAAMCGRHSSAAPHPKCRKCVRMLSAGTSFPPWPRQDRLFREKSHFARFFPSLVRLTWIAFQLTRPGCSPAPSRGSTLFAKSSFEVHLFFLFGFRGTGVQQLFASVRKVRSLCLQHPRQDVAVFTLNLARRLPTRLANSISFPQPTSSLSRSQ